MNLKKTLGLLFVIFTFFVGLTSVQPLQASEPFFNLKLKANSGGVRPDYGLFIAVNLRKVGIEIDVKVDECYGFSPYIFPYKDVI